MPVLPSGWLDAYATSTLAARAATQVRIIAPWLTMATVSAPVPAASATTVSKRPRASTPFSPPGILRPVSPSDQAKAVVR